MSPCAYLKPTVVQITFDVRRVFRVNKCHIEYAIIVLINYSKKHYEDYVYFFITIPTSEILAME